MKLQIDTQVKTITIEESIGLGELFQLLNEMFPDFKWKEYLLIPSKVIHEWKNPIVIDWNPRPWINPYNPLPGTTPWSPWYTPTTCGSESTNEVNRLYYAGNSDQPFAYGTSDSVYNLIVNKK